MSVVVKTSLSARGTPPTAMAESRPRPPICRFRRRRWPSALVGSDVEERPIVVVGHGDLVEMSPRHLDRRQLLAAIFAEGCRVEPNDLCPLVITAASSQDLRDGESAVDRRRRLGQRLLLGEALSHRVGPGDVDVPERIVGGFDAGDVDGPEPGLHGPGWRRVGRSVIEFAVGQREPGQLREPRDIIKRSGTRSTSLKGRRSATVMRVLLARRYSR